MRDAHHRKNEFCLLLTEEKEDFVCVLYINASNNDTIQGDHNCMATAQQCLSKNNPETWNSNYQEPTPGRVKLMQQNISFDFTSCKLFHKFCPQMFQRMSLFPVAAVPLGPVVDRRKAYRQWLQRLQTMEKDSLGAASERPICEQQLIRCTSLPVEPIQQASPCGLNFHDLQSLESLINKQIPLPVLHKNVQNIPPASFKDNRANPCFEKLWYRTYPEDNIEERPDKPNDLNHECPGKRGWRVFLWDNFAFGGILPCSWTFVPLFLLLSFEETLE